MERKQASKEYLQPREAEARIGQDTERETVRDTYFLEWEEVGTG